MFCFNVFGKENRIMVKMPSQAQIQQRYTSAIPIVAERYKNGVDGTTDWKTRAIEGQGLYVQRMQDQSVLARRESGLQKVSDAEWKQNALSKGVQRIGPGMTAGASKQASGYEPVRKELEALTLAPRVADSNTNIDNRVKAVVAASKRAVGKS
jgi:hypothetical protein